jgi:ABC-type lipoprotein release transport system permease subunit
VAERPGLGFGASIQLAARNLRRNPRRTAFTLGSMVLGIAGLTFLGALNDGWLADMKDNFIRSLSGHLQVHAQGYQQSGRLTRRIREPEAVTRVVADTPGVAAWTPRVRVQGLATTAGRSGITVLYGVDPQREGTVTDLPECLQAGRWLLPGEHREMLLGPGLAASLGVAVGDKVILTAHRADGAMTTEAFLVRGILCPTGPQVDRGLGVVSLATLADWLGLGDDLTDVVVRLDERAGDVAGALEVRLAPLGYEVVTWQELDPVVSQWVSFSEAYGVVVVLIVVALVVLEVLNTMLMAHQERRQELAVMLSLGTRPPELFRLVLLEAMLLVVLGAVLGYALGALAVQLTQGAGIDLSGYADALEFFYMSPVIHPRLTTETELRIMFTTLVSALVAGVYPAIKAARVEVGDVLHAR